MLYRRLLKSSRLGEEVMNLEGARTGAQVGARAWELQEGQG